MSTGTDLLVRIERSHLVIPESGVALDLAVPESVADALDYIDGLIRQLQEAKRSVTVAAVEICEREGVRTLQLDDGRKIELSSSSYMKYEPEQIRDGLIAAGMPLDRVDEVCVPSYKVNASKAKQAASANDAYRQVIDEHTEKVTKTVYASVK